MNQVYLGDCLEVLPTLAENSIDLILTDPPYGLSFMGKNWDHGVPGVQFWIEALRVAKPGAHLFAFGGTRTFHRLAVAIEDAGWEIRDTIMWVYGSGFPKSHDVSKAIDKAAGVEFDALPASGVGFMNANGTGGYNVTKNQFVRKGERTPEAKQWQGWGTALKPAFELIIMARKPLTGTVAENVLQWGTGGINIDACRVAGIKGVPASPRKNANGGDAGGVYGRYESPPTNTAGWDAGAGRWPANFIHDGSEEVVGLFPYQKSGEVKPSVIKHDKTVVDFRCGLTQRTGDFLSSEGSAARFFYCAKASKSERGEGNIHPTVKPLALMKYLITLGLPPGGTVLDPFAGSGTTAIAALELGQKYICIEKSPEYYQIILDRIDSFNQLSLPINMY